MMEGPPAAPVACSWPNARAVAEREQGQQDGDELLSNQQLKAWRQSLNCDDNCLVISADSLHLLPPQMPYELLGPCILAAVDRLAAPAAAAPSTTAVACTPQQKHQQPKHRQQKGSGLRLYGVDLQEPIAGPLATCFSAYPFLQHLSLQELNIDSQAAAALGSNILQQQQQQSGLLSLCLRAVFMCDMAWQALMRGIAAGCCLQTLRLHDCAGIPGALAAAVSAGCSSLQQLDISSSTLAQHQPSAAPTGSGQHTSGSGCADHAWASFIDALSQPSGCPVLQELTLNKCALGPAAGAALVRLLRAKCRTNLRRLALAGCAGMGEAALRQLAVAAGSHPGLQALDLSCNACTDSCVSALLGQGNSWRWQPQRTCAQLQQLHLAGNSALTGAAVEQLAKVLAAGSGLTALHTLDLANCPGIGDAGAVALSSCLGSCCCVLHTLNLSGCEVTDTGAAALAAAVANTNSASSSSSRGGSASRHGQASGSRLQQLRLADNQITATGILAWSEAIRSPSCVLQLLDVSFNFVGPEAVKPLADGAAAAAAAAAAARGQQRSQQQEQLSDSKWPASTAPIKVLCECSHDLWRVEAAKAAARAAVAADAAAEAAAVAAAAAAAAGSSWHPDSSDQLSVREHPAAATALGFANSSYEGCSGSSLRTHAGSPDRGLMSPFSCRKRPDGSAVWLYNGLFCDPGEAWSPDSPPNAAQPETAGSAAVAAAKAAAVKPAIAASLTPLSWGLPGGTRLVFVAAASAVERGDGGYADGQPAEEHDAAGEGQDDVDCSGSSCHGSECSSSSRGNMQSGASSGSRLAAAAAVEDAGTASTAAASAACAPHASSAAPATTAAANAAEGHVPCLQPAATAACTAACEEGSTRTPDGSSSSSCGGDDDDDARSCIQQEVSFRCQLAADDVVHSPTRYDQQQQQQLQQQEQWGQQQQLKGLLGCQEFTLSPPNPLFFSNSPLTSPIAPRKLAGYTPRGGVLDAQPVQLRLRVRPQTAGQHTASVQAGVGSSAQPLSQPACAAVDALQPTAARQLQQQPATAAATQANRSTAAAARGSGVRAALQLRQPFSPDRQLAAPTVRALPPGSPRRRCALNTTPPSAAALDAVGSMSAGPPQTAPIGAAAAVAGRCGGLPGGTDNRELPASLETAPAAAAAASNSPVCSVSSAEDSTASSSIGSSGSPLAFASPSKAAARQRVTQPGAHHQPTHLQGTLGEVPVPVCQVNGSNTDNQQVAGGAPKAAALQSCSQLQLQPARQLFRELQGCEVKAVSSSASYWGSLWGGADCGEQGGDVGVVAAQQQAARNQAHALPLVGG